MDLTDLTGSNRDVLSTPEGERPWMVVISPDLRSVVSSYRLEGKLTKKVLEDYGGYGWTRTTDLSIMSAAL